MRKYLFLALSLPFLLAPKCPTDKGTLGWISKYRKGKSIAQMEDEICRKELKFIIHNYRENGCIYYGLKGRRWCQGGERQDFKDTEALYKLELKCILR